MRRLVLLTFAIAALPSGAQAQNPRDTPLGGRTSMMGGAATAAGNDSAMPYLNPAGLTRLSRDVFSLSANVYGFVGRRIDPFLHPDGFADADATIEEERFDGRSVQELPGSVMYALPLGDAGDSIQHVLAASVIIPNSERVDVSASYIARVPSTVGSYNETRNVVYESTAYYFGPTYAIAIDDWLRLGASVYGRYHRFRTSVDWSWIKTTSNGSRVSHSASQTSTSIESVDLVLVLGAQIQLGGLSFGLAATTPGLSLAGSYEFAQDFSSTRFTGVTQRIKIDQATSTYAAQSQPRLNFGVAYEMPKVFAIALDLVWFLPLSGVGSASGVTHYAIIETDQVARDYRRAEAFSDDLGSSVDLSLGAEIWLTDAFALRAGVFTNLPTYSLPEPEYSLAHSNEANRVGVSLGLGMASGAFDTTFGMIYQYGFGSWITPTTELDGAVLGDLSEHFLMLVVSGAVSFGGLL